MRVIAGRARRTILKTPSGLSTRPTTDRIKETLFNMINNDLVDSRFLDLFSGSGGIGIEALSRGASFCVFVENNKEAIECIKENIEKTRFANESKILFKDVNAAIKELANGEKFDIIFMDPPYNMNIEKDILIDLKSAKLVDVNTIIIIEASIETEFDFISDIGYDILKIKEYKTNKHIFISIKDWWDWSNMGKAIYPGSFDPVTLGHEDVIKRASKLVDTLIVAVLKNSSKTPLFTVEERMEMLKEVTKDIKNVRVMCFDGFLVEFAKEQEAATIVRGLRAITDFEYELQMAQTNRVLNHEVDTIFLTTSVEYSYLSSSIVREVASLGGNIDNFVPKVLLDKVYNKLK